jgi:uncharacterized protein (DUF342 family)
LKPSPDKVGPIDRKEIAEIEAHARHQAEIARKQMLDPKEIEKITEQAKREAARAAVDAEKFGRAEQKRQIKRGFKEGSQKQLDELHKRLEMLEREREKLEHQIEVLERNQEQLDEQRDENQDNDAQSEASEFNADSIQLPRK